MKHTSLTIKSASSRTGSISTIYSIQLPNKRAAARANLKLNPDDRVAVFVGRSDYPKNEEWLLDVAAASRDRSRICKVLLVGEGPHEAMLQRANRPRKPCPTSCASKVIRTRCPIYRAADAILLPSIREGFSFVCAEAMATGVPALCMRTERHARADHRKRHGQVRCRSITMRSFRKQSNSCATAQLRIRMGMRRQRACSIAILIFNCNCRERSTSIGR